MWWKSTNLRDVRVPVYVTDVVIGQPSKEIYQMLQKHRKCVKKQKQILHQFITTATTTTTTAATDYYMGASAQNSGQFLCRTNLQSSNSSIKLSNQ